MLDNALREPAARWEVEGIGFRLATDYRRAQKKRRGPSCDSVVNGGRVLHHLCWADDLYAMAGTKDHLTRILRDMTNSIEQLGMQWKEKSPHCCCRARTRSTRLGMSLRSSATRVDDGCGVWWRGMEALGSWLASRGCSEAGL